MTFHVNHLLADNSHDMPRHIWFPSAENYLLNFFLAGGDFCRLLITSANSLDPDPDPNCLTL